MLTIDRDAWTVEVDGTAVDLTFREFRLLAFLAGHPGRAFRRDELIKAAWSAERPVTERSVDLYVARLRSKLGDAGHRLIRTVQQVGYRFDPPDQDFFVLGASKAVRGHRADSTHSAELQTRERE